MLILLSLDHRRASVAEREPFSLAPEELARLSRMVRRAARGQVAFLVTCNRAEVICAVDTAHAAEARAWIARSARRMLPALGDRFLQAAAVYTGTAAARHLLRVTAGLESQVLGDAQVLGQVRAAYERATGAGVAGAELHRLFQTALRAGKRVQHETQLGRRAASVGTLAAAEMIRRLEQSGGATVAVIGAGRTAECAARKLAGAGLDLTILNRTEGKAELLAQSVGGAVAPFERRHEIVAAADAAIVVTGARAPVVTAERLEAARRIARNPGALLLVDLGLPRNIDPDTASLPGVSRLGLESFTDETASLCARLAAEQIIDQELGPLMTRLAARGPRERAVA